MEHLQCKQLPFPCDLESQSKFTNANRIPRTFLNAPNMELRTIFYKRDIDSHPFSVCQKPKN